jgi:class 3 adenylate cyclase
LNLVFWILALGLRYGLSIPVLVQKDEAEVDNQDDYTPVIAIINAYESGICQFSYLIILLIGSYLNDIVNRKRFLQGILLVKQQGQIIRAKTMNERTQKAFLENILPPSLVGELQVQQKDPLTASAYRRVKSLSKSHVGVSMLFADLVGFTAFSSQVDPFKVMSFLNDLFNVFDGLCDQYNVYKLETIGDCYVATVGLMTGKTMSRRLHDADAKSTPSFLKEQESMRGKEAVANGRDLVGFAKAMLMESRQVVKPEVNTPAIMRIGIHTGSCISGIIGTKNFRFCLFGDMVSTAAEMETKGTADYIHASQDIVDLVPEEAWQKHQNDSVKKQTYLLCV